MEPTKPKRNFSENATGKLIVSLAFLALVVGMRLYLEQRHIAKREAAELARTQASRQAYLDGVERGARIRLRLGEPESEVVDSTVSALRRRGATESEIDALKKHLLASANEKK